MHFEKLTKEYFCALGRRMDDKSRFFIWRQNGKIIAFISSILQDDMLHGEYLGLDYEVAIDLHLYHYTFRDLINWGIAHGYKWFHSSALNYDPKFHLRYRLDPIDLYVRHTSTICNSVFSRLVHWLEPTRYEKTLKRFANYDELWVPAAMEARPRASVAIKALIDAKQSVQSAIAGIRARVTALLDGISEPFDSAWAAKLGVSSVALATTTAALLAVDTFFELDHLTFVFLLPVFIIAAKFGKTHGAIASAASCLIAAFYFYTPKFSIIVNDPTNLAELASFGAMALMVSKYAGNRAGEALAR
jgi:Domain of unknown function (DUF4118)/Acetyltransferase (GNAT) domain